MDTINFFTSQKEALEVISKVLNNVEMLFELEVYIEADSVTNEDVYLLVVDTNKECVIYQEDTKKGMNNFLIKLKKMCNNKQDIIDLKDELVLLTGYHPKNKTEKLIEEIRILYYEKNLTISTIAKELNIYSGTVSNVLKHNLYGTRTLSEKSSLAFNSMDNQKRKNFFTKSLETRKNNPEYIQKLSEKQTGMLNNQAKLTDIQVIEIRNSYKDMLDNGYKKLEAQNILAEEFKVKRSTISDIVLFRTWKKVNKNN